MKSFPFRAGLWVALLAAAPVRVSGQGSAADYERAQSLRQRIENKVWRTGIQPRWLPDSSRFWYTCETGPGLQEWVLVDPVAATRTVTRDPDRLPQAPAVKTSEIPMQGRRTRRTGPASRLTFVNQLTEEVTLVWVDPEGISHEYGTLQPGGATTQNTFAGHQWQIKAAGGKLLASLPALPGVTRLEIDGPSQGNPGGEERRGTRGNVSPDGKKRIALRDHNLFLVSSDGAEKALTQDGNAGNPYLGEVAWAPDSQAFVATRVIPAPEHPVHMVDSSPRDQVQPKLVTRNYLKPGDPLPQPRPVVVDLANSSVTAPEPSLFPTFFTEDGELQYRWEPDSRSFTFDYNQRGHQLYRILSVDRAGATARVVVEEKSDIFIDYTNKTWRHPLDASREILWMSERDGWCHLYLWDAATGAMRQQITRGDWVVRRVEWVDEANRQIWFMASGLRPGEDPYHQHLCRVRFDGSEFRQLTEGDGSHQVKFSPDRKWFVDEWSRADLPPVTELRRSEDGSLILVLERADVSRLAAEGWAVPERFSAPGRDGKTAIHGTIVKPYPFDPSKQYPVLEEVYAGPHGAFAAKEFSVMARQQALAQLGFVVVQADGMGTNYRGREFHRIAWKNLADAGFPDRKAWIRAAAETRPWMDLKRVGIYGGSAGGQSAMRALLDHADLYKAAAADCGCHDNRMDKIWWNEQWLGWPLDDSYEKSSNVVDAPRLQGHLLLTVGELDTNVDPASTMQVAAALIRADKDFELLVLPGSNHGAGESPYAARRRMDFFVKHLMGVTPRWQP